MAEWTDFLEKYLTDCTLCPRNCHVDRYHGETGFCGQGLNAVAARAALHFWEEPCISGTSGSGTVFFSGCNLKCIFCQNREIALGNAGLEVSLEKLTDIFLNLQQKGANNINLVTASHFIPQVAISLKNAKQQGLSIPVVYNSSGYESVPSLRLLDGLIDIYLPDMKYFSSDLSNQYSHAPDYFQVASAALQEMFRQTGKPEFFPSSGKEAATCTSFAESKPGTVPSEPEQYNTKVPLMKKGMIVRHMLLPGETKDSKKILRFLHETYQDDIFISIMNQYTPMPQVSGIPTLSRKVSDEEYHRVLHFAERIGIVNGFYQFGETSDESFIPSFHYEGLG